MNQLKATPFWFLPFPVHFHSFKQGLHEDLQHHLPAKTKTKTKTIAELILAFCWPTNRFLTLIEAAYWGDYYMVQTHLFCDVCSRNTYWDDVLTAAQYSGHDAIVSMIKKAGYSQTKVFARYYSLFPPV